MADYERRLEKLEALSGDRKVSYVWISREYSDDGDCIAVTLAGKHRTERREGETEDELLERAKAAAGKAKAIAVSWKRSLPGTNSLQEV